MKDSKSTLETTKEHNVIELASRTSPERRRLVEKLFARHGPALRLFLRGRAVPHDQIEDLEQDVFTRLMVVSRLEEKMSGSTGSNRSFLLTMANNMIVDRQRKQNVRRAYAATQMRIERERMDEHSPERIVAAQLELEAIRDVILAMRPHWRMAFVLQRFHNMNYEQIALHMGLTKKQAEHYVLRAFRRIRQARRTIKAKGEDWC